MSAYSPRFTGIAPTSPADRRVDGSRTPRSAVPPAYGPTRSASAATIRTGGGGEEGGNHRLRAEIKRRSHHTNRKEDQAVQPDPSGVPTAPAPPNPAAGPSTGERVP